MNFLNVAIQLIYHMHKPNVFSKVISSREMLVRNGEGIYWRKKSQSGFSMTLYIVLIVTQLYSQEKIDSKDIQNLFSVLYLKGKTVLSEVRVLALLFSHQNISFLKEMFNCIKPLYTLINGENRTAEMMWQKTGLFANNL